jgi:hypothetical protein
MTLVKAKQQKLQKPQENSRDSASLKLLIKEFQSIFIF